MKIFNFNIIKLKYTYKYKIYFIIFYNYCLDI